MKKYLLALLLLPISFFSSHAQCPLDAPMINESDTKVCFPQLFILHATPISDVIYQWRKAGNTIAGATHGNYTASVSGLYTVEISNGTCTSPASLAVRLSVIETPVANAGQDQYALAHKTVTLGASGGERYSWSPSEGLSDPNISNPSIKISNTTEFMVTVADATNTCKSMDAVKIIVVNPTSVTQSLSQSGITLFPNPTTESFNIEMPESGIAVRYEILDLTGAAVAQGNFVSTGNAEKITTNFGAGMYQVVLHYNDVVSTGRLSKVQ